MGLIVFWILCGVAGAAMLSRYDKAGTGCLLGGLLGPIGLIIAWTMRDSAKVDEQTRFARQSRSTGQAPRSQSEQNQDSRPRRKCPFCAELILLEARVCKHCGREVGEGGPSEALRPWLYCNELIPQASDECPNCLVVAPFD